MEQQKQLSEEKFKKAPIYRMYAESILKMVSELDKMWSNNAKSLGIKYEHGKIK